MGEVLPRLWLISRYSISRPRQYRQSSFRFNNYVEDPTPKRRGTAPTKSWGFRGRNAKRLVIQVESHHALMTSTF
jgi:hypothetical protein